MPPTVSRILVLCTGNVCRSPYIERMLRRDVASLGIEVVSAGTGALAGQPMDPASLTLLDGQGIDGRDFVARQLTAEMVRDADLVIGAAREHVDAAARLHPKALRYAFALRDLGDLLDEASDDELAAGEGGPVARVAAAAVSSRGRVQPRRQEESTVLDPYRQGPQAFAAMAAQVGEALPVVVSSLRRSSAS